jgi:plastocyanin
MQLRLAALGMTAALALAGCASDTNALGPAVVIELATQAPAAPTTTLAPVTVSLTVGDNEYTPTEVRVPVGSTLIWSDLGKNVHDIIPSAGPAGFGVSRTTLVFGTTYSYTFTTPGRYIYYCSIHGTANGKGMAGTVVVTA